MNAITLTETQYDLLRRLLFQGDGNESIALAFCGSTETNAGKRFFLNEILPISNDACPERTPISVVWTAQELGAKIYPAIKRNWSIVKIHSHPTDYANFSVADDKSDRSFFGAISHYYESCPPSHVSMVFLNNGDVIARIVNPDGAFTPIDRISIVGDDLRFINLTNFTDKEVGVMSHRQLFGGFTTDILRQMKIGVIGCSGTGSIIIEQLSRLGVGALVLVDPDKVERRNLNRILNTNAADAIENNLKVDVIKKAVESIGFGTKVEALPINIISRNAILAIADCDIVFGCMDKDGGVAGRYILNKASAFYMIPYFDLGVKLVGDGKGGVDNVCGTVNYISPGYSGLIDRGVITDDQVSTAMLKFFSPTEYEDRVRQKYLDRVAEPVPSPAVISVNMHLAAIAVNELLSRIHHFRYSQNKDRARIRFDLANDIEVQESFPDPCSTFNRFLGWGTVKPFLNQPNLDF